MVIEKVTSIENPKKEDLKDICHSMGGIYNSAFEYCILDDDTLITALHNGFTISSKRTTITIIEPKKVDVERNTITGEKRAKFLTKDNNEIKIYKERFATISAYLK